MIPRARIPWRRTWKIAMGKRLPPSLGLEANKPLLYSAYQQEFLKARRMRWARCCSVIGYTGSDGLFRCPKCGTQDIDAKRIFRRLGCFAGRRGGKSIVGAHGAREEVLVPNSVGWVCGPTYEVLHDATMPTFLKLIPKEWVANWDQEHLQLTLINNAQVMFRSLHDPDRAHSGVGLHWAWLDEAAFIQETAWDFLRPSLTDFGGVAFFTSSVDGYDWTYERVEKPALIDKKPGFWAAKWRTIDNPYIAVYRADEVEEARLSMPPQFFRQEYEGERENFTGSVYAEYIDGAWLADDGAIQDFIPEWPRIDASRRVLVGLDSGADHPFGAAQLVVTEKGIVVINDYLERQRSFSAHLLGITTTMKPPTDTMWAANKNEAQLRLEFAAHGVLVAPAENDQMAGIQRVMSWLYTKQLKIAYTAPRTFEQMKQLRYNPKNTLPDKQKAEKEKVFKLRDELPDAIRYALMTWPSLPKVLQVLLGRDLSAFDEKTRWEIEKMKKFHGTDTEDRELTPVHDEFSTGDFYAVSDYDFEERSYVG